MNRPSIKPTSVAKLFLATMFWLDANIHTVNIFNRPVALIGQPLLSCARFCQSNQSSVRPKD